MTRMGIVASHVGKTLGQPPTQVLTDISLEIRDGEFVAVTGRSGSGKSSLLYLLSSLDAPSQGRIEVDEQDLSRMSARALNRFRNTRVGFVFQFHYLLADFNALENVLLPARKAGLEAERRAYAISLLERFGLADKLHRLPRQLSGGEQQRLAIARALVMEPRYLFADEPTGSLDSANSATVMDMLRQVNAAGRATVILVTHEPAYARFAARQIFLADGRIVPPPSGGA
jgi:putative ABC transport system ATP-binding protein/lipoprotein-releasing system ATP-binding protein